MLACVYTSAVAADFSAIGHIAAQLVYKRVVHRIAALRIFLSCNFYGFVFSLDAVARHAVVDVTSEQFPIAPAATVPCPYFYGRHI